MKTIQKLLLGMFVGVLLLPTNAISQNEVKENDKEEFKPVYHQIHQYYLMTHIKLSDY